MKRQWIFALVAVSALAADDANVKAFVPSMLPTHHIDAVYPDAAKQQNVYGSVMLFVTIDASGNVTAAEAAQGQRVLRDAAIDAVKQWVYRPVMREGQAVAALTTATVMVMPPRGSGEMAPPAQRDFDALDAMRYGQRLSALSKRFPRSADQVLADNEQQTAGDGGEQRFAELPRLAKAALKAGDLAKAQGYATELLKLAPQHLTNWAYGNAVHDGNIVMGAVALQQGATTEAVQYLLSAGKTPGSPQLDSFGPNMTLAKALIDAGQSAAVLDYFNECRVFWKMGDRKLDEWSAMVRGGGKPNFGANLLY